MTSIWNIVKKVLFKEHKGQTFESFLNSWNLKNTKGIINKIALYQKQYWKKLYVDSCFGFGEWEDKQYEFSLDLKFEFLSL